MQIKKAYYHKVLVLRFDLKSETKNFQDFDVRTVLIEQDKSKREVLILKQKCQFGYKKG